MSRLQRGPAPAPGPGAPPVRPARPAGTLRIGRVAGSDVLVSPSWFVVAGLIAVVMAPAVEQVSPGLGPGRYVAGLAFAVILYGSVLLHEISHAVVARRCGHRVTSITLHFLGGMTTVDGEARRPRDEFWIAVVGPLTSIAVGVAALGALTWAPDGLPRLGLRGLAGANLLVGVLNLVPGLPLDGGRVLRAVIWGATGDSFRGSVVAAWGGRVTAVLVVLSPLAQGALGLDPGLTDVVLALVVAAFLWMGADAALGSARLRRGVPRLVARDLARRALGVPEDLPLAEALRRAQESHAGAVFTTSSTGDPIGLVSEAAVAATPQERRPWVSTSTVARAAGPVVLPADLVGEDLVAALTRVPASEYLLLETGGEVYGVLSAADVDRALRRVGATGA